jgi:hypothetical protein
MIWYFLLVIILVIIFVGSYVYYLHRKDEDWMDIITDSKRRIIAGKLIILAVAVSTVFTYRPLWETIDCTIYANSLGTTGTYSWYYKECNLEPTKNGLIPKSKLRGSTNDHSGNDDGGN